MACTAQAAGIAAMLHGIGSASRVGGGSNRSMRIPSTGELLVDLLDALADSDQSDLAEKQAQKLKANNPKLRLLTSELRRHGFTPK